MKNELAQFDPEQTQCTDNEITTSVTVNSRRYNYTLKKKPVDLASWEIHGSIASPSYFTYEDSELQNRINSFSIQLSDEQYQLLKINNSNTAPYTLTALDYEEALKRVLRYVDGDKGIVKTKADLSTTPQAIMGSVAEQLQALKYMVPVVQSFCESKLETTPRNPPKKHSSPPIGI